MTGAKRIMIDCVLSLLILWFGGAGGLSLAQTAPAGLDARGVIEKVTTDAISALRDPKLSIDDKRQKIKEIAYANINFDVMARLSLGRYYRDLSDADRTQYLAEFKEHLTNTYGHTTDDYDNEDVKITGDRKEVDGDWNVSTHILGVKENKPNQEVADVEYRLRQQDGQWKIIDLTIDGVSLVSNFRSQFQDIMTNGGIDQLLKLLHDKIAANDKEPTAK
jgi:phospholipid transport system substrate-binding protein